jgi:hypothetical protein
MFMKGKLALLPKFVKGRAEMKRIFRARKHS